MNNFLNDILTNWAEFQPYWNAMKDCPQSTVWHGEGDVAIHTEMVLDAFQKIYDESDIISEHEKLIVNYALLLHDVAKPAVMTIEDGLIRAHHHNSVGATIAWELLESTELSLEDRLEITNLIYWHAKPNWIIKKDIDEQERMTIQMSQDCSLKLLYFLAISDYHGRFCDDKEEQLEAIEYFKLLAEQLECYENSYKFSTPDAKFKYLVKKSHHYTDNPYNDLKSTVYLMCGLPGSGKDTYIRNTFRLPVISLGSSKNTYVQNGLRLPVISLDEIRKELKIKPTDEQGRVIQEAKSRAKKYLADGISFVWNATNITRQIRQGLIQLFTEYNAYVEIHFIATPYKVCELHNKNRDEKEIVPQNVMEKMKRKLQVPMNSEAHIVKYKQNY